MRILIVIGRQLSCFIPVFWLCTFASAFAQQKINLEETISDYYRTNYQEMVYVHRDKPYYLTGERIKFNIFCLEKLTNSLSALSKVAYVELLDQDNIPKIQARIELDNGTGAGELFIPTSLPSGNFVLRAYTRWMRNYGPETFYHDLLPIINPFRKLGPEPLSRENQPTINFYPESNVLIDGQESTVVVETSNAAGYPIALNGILFANDSLLITTFSSNEHGLGSFDFIPDIRQSYHVRINDSDGMATRHSIPSVQAKGLGIQLETAGDRVTIRLFCNDTAISKPTDQLYLLVHQKDQILETRIIQLQNYKYSFQLDNNSLRSGINTFSLFNANKSLLKQRQLFSWTGQQKKTRITAEKDKYYAREKVAANIDNANQGYIAASFSASTYHPNLDHQGLSLQDYVLLDNELTRKICGLSSILTDSPRQSAENINRLLIAYSTTDEWWNNSISHTPRFIPEYRFPLITGSIIHKDSKLPAAGIMTYLSIPGDDVQFYCTQSKIDGSLSFELKNFYGLKEVVVQNDYTRDTIYNISIDDPFCLEYLPITMPSLNIDEQMADWIRVQSQQMQVNNAYARYRPKLPTLQVLDTTRFYNEPDATYLLDDYTRFVVMEEVMREYVAGVNVRKNQDGFHFMVIDMERNIVYENNPLMLYDAVPVFDADEIIVIDPLKVAKIETVRRRFHKGFLDCRGIVNYTSYKGNMDGYALNKHAMVFNFEGLQLKKHYYSPVYQSKTEQLSPIPDFRSNLIWIPNLDTDHVIPSEMEFFTSDSEGTYEMRVEGISENGDIISSKAYIQVSGAPNK